ncbi:MAG: hypothetical protein WC708_06540 [Lentisphaeria bacterium]
MQIHSTKFMFGVMTGTALAVMTPVLATGATVYKFAAGFNGTLKPDVQPAGSVAPVATGTGAAVNSSTYKYGTGSLQVQSDATGAIRYDWSAVPVTGWGTVGLWYNPSYTPSAATGSNTLFQAVAATSGDGWTSGVSLFRSNSTLTLALNWDYDWSFDSVTADISGWTADSWHYIECQWALKGSTELAIYIDGVRTGFYTVGWAAPLTKTMPNLYVGGNAGGTFSGANGYLDGFWYNNDANPTSMTCVVPTMDVPEPAMAAFLALGGLACLRRRR